MQTRQLGGLWPVSALTLGGGGIGQLWGETTRDECVATTRAAVDGGINLLDMAPTVLDLFGVQIPAYMQGSPLFDGTPRSGGRSVPETPTATGEVSRAPKEPEEAQ